MYLEVMSNITMARKKTKLCVQDSLREEAREGRGKDMLLVGIIDRMSSIGGLLV